MEATVRGEQEHIKTASISSEGSVNNADGEVTTVVFIIEVEVEQRCGKWLSPYEAA